MRNLLPIKFASSILFLILFPHINFGQGPNLGAASDFALLSGAGAFSNDGATFVNGDIGTKAGAFTGFPPGTVMGQIHVADAAAVQGAAAINTAYAFLSGVTCGQVIGTTLGNGQILTPDVYCLGGASVLNGDLILDGQCDPDAIFIIKINGALSTNPLSNVILRNNASICNVYWQINGALELGPGSVFRGVVLGDGAIELLEGSSLFGQGLTRAGAIALHNNTVDIDKQPSASVITAGGATSFCAGGSVTLSGNCGGVWSNGATTPTITVTTSGNYSVTNSNDCGTATSNHIIVTVNPAPVCTITGNLSLCVGQSTTLCAPAGAASYLWSNGATTNCITTSVAGTYSITVTNANSCSSICNATVTASPAPVCTITGNLSICLGQSTQLCAPAGATSYLWSTGGTGNCVTVSTAGTYSVTVTNAAGCSSVCSAAVVVTPLPVCTITGDLSICLGQTTQLCVPAGAASYLWSNGAVTNCITVSVAGTYAVTVTNAAGCSSICSAAVVVSPLPICTITGNLSICQGQTTQLCVPAGAASYLWSNGAGTNCITVSAAGTYAVTVTNAAGCSSVCSAAVVVNPLPICAITGNLSICLGQTTQLCVPAGAASYLWSNGSTTNCITVSTAGTYAVTVTNAVGCSSICSATVIANPIPICTITGNLSVCQGQITQLCVPAGAASYLWSNGSTTNCITVSTAGTYAVTVTNAVGCSSICSAAVVVSPLPICNITGNLSVCLGQTTQLCVPAGAASYLWSNGSTTNCITVSAAGTYNVTVTNVGGCSSICSATVVLNPLPVCTITGNNFICNANQTTQLCVPAGAASYLWSTGATTNCINVGAGTYSVTVTSAAGCSSICSETVTINPQPVCLITGNDFICETGQTTQICVPSGAINYLWSTGATTNCITVGAGTYSVTVTNAGGCTSVCSKTIILNAVSTCSITGDLSICPGQSTLLCVPAGATSYLWSNGAITNCINVNAAGTYSVTVTNAIGCSSICSATVLLSPLPVCTITGNPSFCLGQSTQLCVPPGAASYLWSNGAITNCITVSAAGTYSVTVTNADGCSSICSQTVVVSLLPICTITGNDFICAAGQTTQLCVPPGAASYLWSTGATTNCIIVGAGNYSVTVTNQNGCTSVCNETVTLNPQPTCMITGNNFLCAAGQTTQLCVPAGATSYLWSNGAITNCITVSAAGTYSVTVTYENGCISICSETVTINPTPACTITGNDIICLGQSTQLCVPAGAASYLWSNGATTNCITVSTAGTYSVTITYASGCSSICSETVVVSPLPICTITGNDFICAAGQTTQLCVPPGAASYLWSTGATTNCILVGAGNYSVTVTNQNGCTSVCNETVTLNPQPTCTITGDNFLCATGQTTQLCVPAGATSYLWSTGAITNCITVSAAGTYSVTVTYENGCISVCSETVTINPTPTCTITGNNIICLGQSTQLCVPPGAASYLWSNGQTTNCITVSTAGTYSVTVTYASGCSSICSETVTVSPVPNCTITGDDFICQEGQLTQLCVPAGAASYLWSTGATTNCIIASAAGTYSVTITNANGCTSVCSKTITLNPQPSCTITGDYFICSEGQSTMLCVQAGAGSYLWSTGATTNCITVSTAGTYSVTVTYANGCTSVCSKTVTVNPLLSCIITCDDVICAGDSTQLCVPTGAVSYWWSNGAMTNCITVGTSGTYSVTVTYAGGCTSVCSKTITVSPQPGCEITGNCSIVCGGQPSMLCAPAGCANYVWCTGATTSCIWVNTAGTYCVTVTNAAGCSSVCCITVTGSPAPNCEITGDCNIPCGGQGTQLCAPAGCANYLWSTGATTSCIWVNNPGNYCVTVTNAYGCTSVCSRIVTSGSTFNCDITGNCILPCGGQPTLLCAPPGCASYWWSTGATTSCILVNTPGNYCVTVTNANGCTSVCSRIVTTGLAPHCEITGNCTLPCNGQPTLLCAPSGCASYWWSTGATTSCIIASAPGNYCVTVTNADGCSSTSCVTVTQTYIPLCTITGNTTICGGEPTLLCAPSGCVSYLWNTGANTSCIIAGSPGIYAVTVTYANGCSNTSQVTVTRNPDVACTITGNLHPDQGQSSVLCAPADMASYLWNTGDTTRCITVDTAGTYSVIITSSYGCKDSCNTIVTTSFTTNESDWEILPGDYGNLVVQAYPNPFYEKATIEFHNTESNSHVVIELCKLTGNKIATLFDRDVEQGKVYKVELLGEDLSEGVYVCRIVNGDQIINKKLILIK